MLKTYETLLRELNLKENRYLIKEAIEFIETENKNVYFIILPTGYGKSLISFTIAKYYENKGKVIIALPLRSLLEDQYQKLKKIINKKILGKRYMKNPFSKYLIKPITLTTIDTLAFTFFGMSPEDLNVIINNYVNDNVRILKGHYIFSLFSIFLSDVIIIDEFHLLIENEKAINFLALLIDFAINFNKKLILLSATVPKKLLESIINKFSNEKIGIFSWNEYNIGEICKKDQDFIKFKSSKKIKEFRVEEVKNLIERVLEIVEENLDYDKILIVVNTIKTAQEIYLKLKEIVKDREILLLHSLFTEEDKKKKIELLQKIKNEKYIVVSTQVIEAGVDMSSNLLITEISPPTSLIQRVGRFLRWGEKEGKLYILKEEKSNSEFYKVYDKNIITKTFNWLKGKDLDSKFWFLEYKEFLDDIYNEEYIIDISSFGYYAALANLNNFIDIIFDKFVEFKGNFVRDSNIIEVKVNNVEISINLNQLSRFKIIGIEKGGKFVKEKPKVLEYILKNLDNINKRNYLYLLKFFANNKLVIEGKYDEELGLR